MRVPTSPSDAAPRPAALRQVRRHIALKRGHPVGGAEVGVGGPRVGDVAQRNLPLAALRHGDDHERARIGFAAVDEHPAAAAPPCKSVAVGRGVDADEVAPIVGAAKDEIGGEPLLSAFVPTTLLHTQPPAPSVLIAHMYSRALRIARVRRNPTGGRQCSASGGDIFRWPTAFRFGPGMSLGPKP
jgi:hypothetical protein